MPDNFTELYNQIKADLSASKVPDMAWVGKVPFTLVPNGYKIESLESLAFSKHAEFPERKRGCICVTDTQSFLDYWSLYSDEDSQVFADPDGSRVRGLLDYHGMGSEKRPRWCEHEVRLITTLTEEWKTWTEANRKQMEQRIFAEFLEDNAPDIIEPEPALFVEIARDLKAKSDVNFTSFVNEANGSVAFQYNENTQGTFGKGAIPVPERFRIRIPVYMGSDAVTIDVRLRFRINAGKLTLFYVLYRDAAVLRDAYQRTVKKIQDGIKKPVFMGTL